MHITSAKIFYRIKRNKTSTCRKSLLHGDFILLKIIATGFPIWTTMYYLPLAHNTDRPKGN